MYHATSRSNTHNKSETSSGCGCITHQEEKGSGPRPGQRVKTTSSLIERCCMSLVRTVWVNVFQEKWSTILRPTTVGGWAVGEGLKRLMLQYSSSSRRAE